MPRNPANDVTYYCSESEWLDFNLSIDATVDVVSILDNDLDFDLELDGTLVRAVVFNGTFDSISLTLSADFYIQNLKSNWIKWGKIGEFDFTQDKTNLAGEMPMDWAGNVYAIGKLDKSLVVYGSGGISILQPVENVFGKAILLPLGVKSKGAISCQLNFHLFITSDGCLWKLSDKLEKLGYEEFLSTLANPVISYDSVNKLAYICNGTSGYIFNCEVNSLGKGPANITGIGYFNGIQYVMASGTIVPLDAYITTHPTDFNNRNFKSILEVEVGGEFESDLQFGVSYRNDSIGSFSTPIWFNVTMEGRAFPNFFGKEFQFHLSTSEDIRFDYLKVKGMFSDFNPIDA